MAQHTFRLLSAADIQQALSMKEAVTVMKDAFAMLSGRRSVIPHRLHLRTIAHHGSLMVMPSYLPRDKTFGVKILSLFEDNPSRDLAMIQGLMLLLDATSGQFLAMMDGSALTALRTGAASAAATELLARPDARVAAIFGAGAQSETQLEGLCAVRSLETALVFGRSPERAHQFAEKMSERLSIPVQVAKAPQELQEADLICTATTAKEPVFRDADVKAGAHINAVGSYRPEKREVPEETVRRAKLVVDHYDSCLSEAGDILIPLRDGMIEASHLHAELGEIVLQRRSGRTDKDEITLFKSVGNAVQDLTAATHLLAAAERLDLGTKVSL